MVSYTDNHDLQLWDDNEEPWEHRTDMETLDTAVEIRDLDANRTDYTPKDGALFRATDTGAVYLGDGSAWNVADLSVASVETDEISITSGELWREEGAVVGESVGIDTGETTPSGHPELCLWVDHGERTGWQVLGSETYIDPFLSPDPSSTYTVSYWPMDEGTGSTAVDSEGDNDLTLNGPTWQTGVGDGDAYLSFDGTDDTADGSEAPVTGSQNRTLVAWINPTATDSDSVLSAWGSQATGERWTFYAARATSGDGLRIEIEGDGYTSSLVPQTDSWQMVAIVLDGDTLGDHLLYLDGTTEQASGTLTVNTSDGDPVRLGNWNYGTGTNGRYYNGLCDSLFILDRAVSVELLDEYRESTKSRYGL